MTTKKEAIERLDATTSQISTLVRTLALGVLAVTWLFLSGDDHAPPILRFVAIWVLLAVACLSMLAIAADLAQYVVAYRQEFKAYKAADPNVDSVKYNEDCWEYRWRFKLFRLKSYLALLSALILVISIVFAVLKDLICH